MEATIKQQFIIQPEIATIGLKGIYLNVENIRNKETDAHFENYRKEVVQQAYAYTRQVTDIKEDVVIQGYRQLHEAVGAPNRKNLSAPENLYKILAKYGDIPHINLLVDIYNTISIKYRLALGAHDLEKVDGNIHLRFTTGTEKFIPLGENEPKAIRAGEYSYIDDSNEIICYLDVRQIDKTKVTTNTTHVFFVIQGNANTSFPYIKTATEELIYLVKKYCGGQEHIVGQIGETA
jgi:DNA/RNA-binding domain of Phe-tRNA-synthetase-like protein